MVRPIRDLVGVGKMYAVGKVGSLISRSVYTVSGPFHPFGGAVDIVVVQQPDGSFKSSPWYVRFGKFQGVLKTREKVVNISVNGVEAAFHMFLDSNGEAYFLRDADPNGDEGEFVVSPASSGDEQEAPTLRKSKSTSCDSSTMEANAMDNNILARTTTSRRTTILGRMFGRKSIEHNGHSVDRVSSLERAEIAAELLDTKWSTNLSRGSSSHDSNEQPSKSIVPDAGNSDQMEISKIVLQEHSFVHGKEMESNCNESNCNTSSPGGGRNSLADKCLQTTSVKEEVVEIYGGQIGTSEIVLPEHSSDHGTEIESNCNESDCNTNSPGGGTNSLADKCLQTTTVKEEIVEIYTHDISDFRITSTTDQAGSEYLLNDIETDKSLCESIDAVGRSLHNFEGVTAEEIHTKEFLSDGIIEIHSVETEITNGNSEVISHFVTGDPDGGNQNSADSNLPTYHNTDVSTERHQASSASSAQDVVEDKKVIINGAENVGSSAMSSIFSDKVHDAAGIILTDSVHVKEKIIASNGTIEQVVSEEYRVSSNEEDKINVVVQDQAGSVLEHLQARSSDMECSVGTVVEYHCIDSAHDLACKHDVVCPDTSSNVEELLMPENNPEDVTKDSTMEEKAYCGEISFSVAQASRKGEETGECIAQFVNFSNNMEAEDLPIITGEIRTQDTKHDDDENKPISMSGDEIRFTQEETEKTEEALVSFAEHIEEIQFQFSDTESLADRKVMDETRANKTEGGESVESDCDAEEQHEGCNDSANHLENCSVPLIPENGSLPIPGCELHSGDINLGATSLPNLRSHIHDLERSDSVQLSRSLSSDHENNGIEPVKNMNSTEEEPVPTDDPEENSKVAELTSNSMLEDKHASDLKVEPFNPIAELSMCRHLLSEGMGEDAASRAFDSEKVSLEKFRTMKQSLTRNNKLVVRIAGRYFPWDAAAPIVLGMISFSEEQVFEPQGMIKVDRVETSLAPGGSWRIWPFSFRRTRAISTVEPACESIVETSLPTPVKETDRDRSKSRAKRTVRKVRSLTPTSKELASLDLREGKNVITFTFSTAMLGKQQVDCCIYLWKWNTRIVISDVDGTITKSDVLGQFMPLVGVDWSQNGVAHLFSAIKENGYQLLFLSARAISQAHLTRQFLFNLKQDGKALPDGPVVISPDGLFPSLYREVIRRAPHEFKISCLEAIRALFPPDSNPNPFYAGFGNRDTDEISYLKVGIPMGKIFIINPKGEVAVNRRVDTKSYTSLHALVNGMFPPISSSPEQEDYNTWNYWKMPLSDVDI